METEARFDVSGATLADLRKAATDELGRLGSSWTCDLTITPLVRSQEGSVILWEAEVVARLKAAIPRLPEIAVDTYWGGTGSRLREVLNYLHAVAYPDSIPESEWEPTDDIVIQVGRAYDAVNHVDDPDFAVALAKALHREGLL